MQQAYSLRQVDLCNNAPQGLTRQLGGGGCWCVFGVKVGHGLIFAILRQVLGLVTVCVAQKTRRYTHGPDYVLCNFACALFFVIV